jgi:hypothetical protein
MNVTFETKFGKKSGKNEWLTPPNIIEALGSFDLDPCSPINRPFETAKNYHTIEDNGLLQTWDGRVWCNPPYETKLLSEFLKKCSHHENAIALTFARTETKAFFNYVWKKAIAVLFIKGRLKFYHVNGTEGGSAGSPSVLIAYNLENAEVLKNCSIEGKFLWTNKPQQK